MEHDTHVLIYARIQHPGDEEIVAPVLYNPRTHAKYRTNYVRNLSVYVCVCSVRDQIETKNFFLGNEIY